MSNKQSTPQPDKKPSTSSSATDKETTDFTPPQTENTGAMPTRKEFSHPVRIAKVDGKLARFTF